MSDLKTLKTNVLTVAAKSLESLAATRASFDAGITPLQTVNSGSVSNFIQNVSKNLETPNLVTSTSRFGLHASTAVSLKTSPKPELDFIEIIDDYNNSVLDTFALRIVSSLQIDDLTKVTHLRIMKSVGVPDSNINKPSITALIDGLALNSKSKTTENIFNAIMQSANNGVGNVTTNLIANSKFVNQKVSLAENQNLQAVPKANTNRIQTESSLVSLPGLDSSVAKNLKFAITIRNSSPDTKISDNLVVANRQGINVLAGQSVSSAGSIVEQHNQYNFFEVAKLPISKNKKIGNFAEFEFFDTAVVYGGAYSYYVTCISSDGIESARSRIATAIIKKQIPPANPKVLYNVVDGHPHFLISCSGTFLDHVEIFKRGGAVPTTSRVVNTQNAIVSDVAPSETDSDFFHLTDSYLGVNKSSVYVDYNTFPGQRVDYRFYSVDSYGLKSQNPFSCSVVIPDLKSQIPISIPSILAEQSSGGKNVVVTVSTNDSNIKNFIISRRELTTSEHAFKTAETPDYFNLGIPQTAKRSKSRLAPILNQFSRGAWNGIVTCVSGAAQFADESTEYDRVYQYSVQSVDIKGNKSPSATSKYVHVAVKPVIDSPTNISASVQNDGVMISWNQATNDFSPLDLIGDQNVLAASSVRSVFQVERKLDGTSVWDALPATTSTFFIDKVSSEKAPAFRPAFALPNKKYQYRVIAMQSGSYISMRTDPIDVFTAIENLQMNSFLVKVTPTYLNPVSIILSWQYNGSAIDSWEIERCVVNKIFGQKIKSLNSEFLQTLNFTPLANLTRESSRAHSVTSAVQIDENLFTGNRLFVDSNVDLANSYFYRIRAKNVVGIVSDWAFGGINIVDSPFDRKFLSSLSDDEKVKLANDSRPISKWRNK